MTDPVQPFLDQVEEVRTKEGIVPKGSKDIIEFLQTDGGGLIALKLEFEPCAMDSWRLESSDFPPTPPGRFGYNNEVLESTRSSISKRTVRCNNWQSWQN